MCSYQRSPTERFCFTCRVDMSSTYTNGLDCGWHAGECHPQVAADRAVLRGLRRQAAKAEAAAHYDTAIARLLSLSLACQMIPDAPLPDVLDVWRASIYHAPAALVCPLTPSSLCLCISLHRPTSASVAPLSPPFTTFSVHWSLSQGCSSVLQLWPSCLLVHHLVSLFVPLS
jgi:hypothetical protein